ncbi:glycoside hydrolase family 32 protein [Clostridium estertheticum]|uniref:glycoside hydrolase family 32 protein n=1 Tax=Clostridium estertheticum TaxID=238834 RepID=UPI001CF4CACF|nr:glycoside hydrolase family 32 protein [Clostridium estertheticum]MCB2362415.1 glycoside hydrolase family 32 protein [Clostridium estertheticum]
MEINKTHNETIKADKAIEKAKKKVSNRFRLGYHIMAPANWINDPNGLIQYKGEYHVFYQHHPYDENWGPMHWGHVKSKDLVHWEHCPIALAPGDSFDKDGCFSGSAVDNNGELTLIYTGHNYIDKEKDLIFENQNMATSKDGIHFIKYEKNPIIVSPPEDSSMHFRDPKVWKHNDSWYMILGNSTKKNDGRALLYKSLDLKDWKYVGVIGSSNGELGYMWECPDFFELDGKYVLTFSPQGLERKKDLYANLFQTGYMLGNYDYKTNQFNHGSFTELDNGQDFYAAQTFLDDKGRRIVIGWMDMWKSDMPTKKDGWCGALTLPRELSLGNNNKILMNPVKELSLLRQSEHNECKNKSISQNYLLKVSNELLELKLIFDLNECTSDAIGLKILGAIQEEIVLTYNLESKILSLDCSKFGRAKDGVRKIKLDKNEKLSLHIFLDRSSIEVFVNEGEATMTSRIYSKETRAGIELFTNNGEVNIENFIYWTLKDIWK